MIERLSYFDKLYAVRFDDRELTPFEKEIFNSFIHILN